MKTFERCLNKILDFAVNATIIGMLFACMWCVAWGFVSTVLLILGVLKVSM